MYFSTFNVAQVSSRYDARLQIISHVSFSASDGVCSIIPWSHMKTLSPSKAK